MTAAGAVLGLLGYLGFRVLGEPGAVLRPVALAVVATVLGLAGLPPRRRSFVPAVLLGLGVGLLGALSMQVLTDAPPRYPWFGVGVFGLAIGVVAGRDLRDARRFLVPLCTACTTALAAFVAQRFHGALDFTQYVPALVATPAYGALFGFLVSTGLVARHIKLEQDPVSRAYQEIRLNLSGEMAELCERAVTLHNRVVQVLRDREAKGNANDQSLERKVEALVLKVFALARRWQDVEREAGRTNAGELAGRIEALDRKIEGTGDAVARKQYAMARKALASQLGYLRDISRNRERVTAQVYNYLAALERLHLAVLNHRGADAAKLTDELQPILDEIEDVGLEMDIASDAMREADEAAGEVPQTAQSARATEAQAGGEAPGEAASQAEAGEAALDEGAPRAEAGEAKPDEPAAETETDQTPTDEPETDQTPTDESETAQATPEPDAGEAESRLNAKLYE